MGTMSRLRLVRLDGSDHFLSQPARWTKPKLYTYEGRTFKRTKEKTKGGATVYLETKDGVTAK